MNSRTRPLDPNEGQKTTLDLEAENWHIMEFRNFSIQKIFWTSFGVKGARSGEHPCHILVEEVLWHMYVNFHLPTRKLTSGPHVGARTRGPGVTYVIFGFSMPYSIGMPSFSFKLLCCLLSFIWCQGVTCHLRIQHILLHSYVNFQLVIRKSLCPPNFVVLFVYPTMSVLEDPHDIRRNLIFKR